MQTGDQQKLSFEDCIAIISGDWAFFSQTATKPKKFAMIFCIS
jgi:hypothetical protein